MSSKQVFTCSVAVLALAIHGCNGGPSPGSDTGTDITNPGDSGADSGSDVAPSDVAPTDSATDAPSADVAPVDGGMCPITSAVATHTTMMSTMGWAARDVSAGMLMFGCGPSDPPSACLSTMPLADASNLGALASAMPGGHLRILYRSTNSSDYWTRISPDGRFASRGTHIHDFMRSVEVQAGPTAMYDPAYFPDDSRFMYQPNGLSCPITVLTTGTPTSVNFSATGCSRSSSVGLYEHLAVSLDGSDYWATSAGAAAWDDGGHDPTLQDPPPNSPWTAGAETSLTLLANSGTTFMSVSTVSIPTPFQGDGVISPSSTMLMTRLAESTGQTQIAYVLYQLSAQRVGSAVMANITEIGRYCVLGAKPAFSLDEHYVAMHHYITADDAVDLGFTGPSDPHFAEYLTRGASNIYILDLNTGVRTRITNMGPGQYALYPSFRADGWMYFTVRTLGTSVEYIVGSDAALVLP